MQIIDPSYVAEKMRSLLQSSLELYESGEEV